MADRGRVLGLVAGLVGSALVACGGDDTDELRAQLSALQTQVAPGSDVVLAVVRKCQIDGREVEGGWYGLCKPGNGGKRFDRLEVTVGQPGGATRVETVSPQAQVNVADPWRAHTDAWVYDLQMLCLVPPGEVSLGECTKLEPPLRYVLTIRKGDGSTWREDFVLPAPVLPQVGGPWPPR